MLVMFKHESAGGDKVKQAVIYMPDRYDKIEDASGGGHIPTGPDDLEESHMYPELREELYRNRMRWGLGSMYTPDSVTIMAVTFAGTVDADPSFDYDIKRRAAMQEEQMFGPAVKMVGTGV